MWLSQILWTYGDTIMKLIRPHVGRLGSGQRCPSLKLLLPLCSESRGRIALCLGLEDTSLSFR